MNRSHQYPVLIIQQEPPQNNAGLPVNFFDMVSYHASNGFCKRNRAELIRGGKPYFDRLLKMINAAEESLHLQTYIYDDDETGVQVAGALKAAVKRNVDVYLMADGYASQVMSKAFIDDLRKAGIHFRMFEPLLKSKFFYFGRRLHHKMVVADAKYAMVGGINVSNRYNDMPGKPAWLDFAMYAEGEIAKELCVLCWKTWNGYPLNMKITPCEEKEIEYNIPAEEAVPVRLRRQDWVRRKLDISKTYVEMLRTAKSHITIICSYFLPGKLIRRLISVAAARGVQIKVITAGRSDVMTAKYAERWLYDWLLRHKIELYEYQKNILHAKLAVCDQYWTTVGSYNVNNISAYASIELNLDVKDTAFATETEQMLEQIIQQDCIRITEEHHKRTRNIIKQFIRWLSYQFIRTMFYLFTFYFKQRS